MPFGHLLFALTVLQDQFLVFLSSLVWKCDCLANRSLRYYGARSFRNLYIFVDVSFTIISLTDNQSSFLRNGTEGAS